MSIHDFGIYDSIVTPQVSCLELRRRLYKRSLQMKITISSVCNSWRELNAPYLYQSIRITRAVQVDALLNAFNEDEARRQRALEEGKERIPGGSYALMVRELWLDSNICSCQTPDAFKSLVALLKRCTGITVFRKFGRYGCSTPELEETQGILAAQVLPSSSCGDIGLCKPPGPTHIDWAFMNSYVFQHFFAKNPELNDSLPSVRTLELRPSYIDLLEDLPEDSAILRHIPHFPALTCLRVLGSRAFAQAAKFVMPSLRSVMIYSPAFDRDDEDHTISCLLAEHGPKLEELEFDLALHRPRLESIDLEDSCPNLRRLHLPASVFTGTHTLKFGHSNLHTLGIRGMHRLVYDQTNADFQSKLLDFVERFPGLKAVQDLSTKSHEFRERSVSLWNAQDALSYRAFWSGLLGSLEKKGVQLLDWSGEPVKGFEERKFMSIMPCEADKVSEGLICCH
ncbi:hypothetical protein FRB99_000842 [Tulasnella sp. 403]|nr:hypothetical protein FRB99_000842 [Tulasnella sp. 403]